VRVNLSYRSYLRMTAINCSKRSTSCSVNPFTHTVFWGVVKTNASTDISSRRMIWNNMGTDGFRLSLSKCCRCPGVISNFSDKYSWVKPFLIRASRMAAPNVVFCETIAINPFDHILKYGKTLENILKVW